MKGLPPVSRRSLLGTLFAVLCALFVPISTAHAAAPTGFVTRQGGSFVLDGQPFRFGATNNYYLHYSSNFMVDDVFKHAAAMHLKVMRVWTFLECGSADGSVPNSAGACSQGPDHWMQRWDPATGGPIYNAGATGLQQLDFMLSEAHTYGIKLIMALTNNWRDFGGMDQYVTWHGLQFHDQFYTDPAVRQDYQNWVRTVVNRVNTITGVAYKDDPAVFSWELANEPRCINTSLPTSGTCTTQTILDWADTMSTYLKGLDPNHMVSVGDEGFHPGTGGDPSQWPYTITDGVDDSQLTALPNIDFGTYHMYPLSWGQQNPAAWGVQWIGDHLAEGTSLGKPMLLEEFGTTDQGTRDDTYRMWTDAVRNGGGAGWSVWILTGLQDDGQLYPDFDGFRVTDPSTTSTVLSDAAVAIGGTSP